MNDGDDFVVHSFSGDDPIVCKDHVRKKLGLAPFTPKSKSNGKDRKAIAATSDYLDEAGNLLFQVVRFPRKLSGSAGQTAMAAGIGNLAMCAACPSSFPN